MLQLAGQNVQGIGVGGINTCIELPGYSLCFDIGRAPTTATRLPRVLFSHAHSDHMGGVVHHCAGRDMMNMSPPEYVMPADAVPAFRDMLDAWRRLDRSPMPCTVVGVRPGDAVPIKPGVVARAFQALHRVPSVGYALCRQRAKLRAEHVGRSGTELAHLRARGERLTEEIEQVEVAYCGDTLIEVVDREPLVRAARLLILEVTFLDDRVSVASARSMGHVHLDEVLEREHLFADNEAILFTHISSRYGVAEARRILAERLPPSLRAKVHTLIGEPA